MPGIELLTQRDQRAGDVFVGHRPQDREAAVERGAAEQRADLSTSIAPCAMAWSSNESESRIDPAPARAMTAERVGIGVDPFLRAHVGEVPGDLVDGVERELEVLRARPDGRRDLQRIGGREHEHDVLGRLLERLQQRRLRARR